MKVALFDIETSPSLGWFFGPMYETSILKVEQDWFMLSFAWKWLGEDEVHCLALPDFPGYERNKRNDKALVQELWKVLDECDLAIAHNGDQFDIKMSNVRFRANGLEPPSPYQTADTKKIARGSFRFTSNSLDELAQPFGLGRKTPHTGKDLWFDCMAGDPDAWKVMKEYNTQDVALLEQVYLIMRPWSKTHADVAEETDACKNCGGTEFRKPRGARRVRRGWIQDFRCKSCATFKRVKLAAAPYGT